MIILLFFIKKNDNFVNDFPLIKNFILPQIRQWPVVMRLADVGLAGYRSAGISNESKPQGASAGIAKRKQLHFLGEQIVSMTDFV